DVRAEVLLNEDLAGHPAPSRVRCAPVEHAHVVDKYPGRPVISPIRRQRRDSETFFSVARPSD
ncbi:hypothetical protein, partial [Streptomyces formicae]